MHSSQHFRNQRSVLKVAATTLKNADVPFALAGGYAIWARGGRESTHDVDFVVTGKHVDAARAALAAEFEVLENGEDWLFKVARGAVVVDVIHHLPTGDVDDAMLSRADWMSVDSVDMPVMAATDILLNRLLALTEQFCNLSPIIAAARSLREQVDWPHVALEVRANPFASACLQVLTDLRVIEQPAKGVAGV
ncbi:MAG: hypothetical protein ACM3UO_00485 [Bacillota bacterium]